MPEMEYFIPSAAFDNAIKNKEKVALKAVLVGIIGSDPTFATTEYDEATAYVKAESEKIHGSAIELTEVYTRQEDEYTKSQEKWDEEYYGMLLVWYQDNYADERIPNIKAVGKQVYKNKLTLGKAKRQSRQPQQNETANKSYADTHSLPKAPVVMATGNDVRQTRLPIVNRLKQFFKQIATWFKQYWKFISLVTGVIALLAGIVAGVWWLCHK